MKPSSERKKSRSQRIRESYHLSDSNPAKGPTRPQQIFHKTVQSWIRDSAREECKSKTRTFRECLKDLTGMFSTYSFESPDTVTLDGSLFEVAQHSEPLGPYDDLIPLIRTKLSEESYTLINIDGTSFRFGREESVDA